jgi:hypothetical protein
VKEDKLVKKGDLLSLFSSRKNLKKYFCVIFVTVPVWYVMVR